MINKNKRENKTGFTLAELLIVVAIIGVMVAVSIPVFAGKLDKSKEAACLANRRSLLAELRTEQMNGDLSDTPGSVTLTEKQKKEYVCPAGGEITAKIDAGGSVVVKCSYHNRLADVMEDKDRIRAVFASVFTSKDMDSGIDGKKMAELFFSGGSTMIDLNGHNTGAYNNVKSELAKTLNLDVDDFDFAAKTNKQNGIIYLYISESVAGKKTGDSVKAAKIVYRVNTDTGAVGTIDEQKDGTITLKHGTAYSWFSSNDFTEK